VPAEPAPTADGPARRRASWNLRSIVEDVGGRPIAEFQDPNRPTHPYMQWRLDAAAAAAARAAGSAPEEPVDPVGHVYPPLVGATGRALHGSDAEHHAETLATVAPDPSRSSPTVGRSPGPSHRPERIYLHYLLLHLDRLNDAGLAYLSQAVGEELRHRATAERATSSGPEPAEGGPTPTRARDNVQT
jgi:hypothetical protein